MVREHLPIDTPDNTYKLRVLQKLRSVTVENYDGTKNRFVLRTCTIANQTTAVIPFYLRCLRCQQERISLSLLNNIFNNPNSYTPCRSGEWLVAAYTYFVVGMLHRWLCFAIGHRTNFYVEILFNKHWRHNVFEVIITTDLHKLVNPIPCPKFPIRTIFTIISCLFNAYAPCCARASLK